MAITYVGHTSITPVLDASFTITEPAGVAEGDILFVWIALRGTVGYDTPTGWTKLLESLGGNTSTTTNTSIASGQLFYHVRGASAPTLTFNESGVADVAQVRCCAVRGADLDGPILHSSIRELAANSSTVATTDKLAGFPGDYLMVFAAGADNLTISNPLINTSPSTTALTLHVTGGTSTGTDTANAIAGGELASDTIATVQYSIASSARHVIASIVLRESADRHVGKYLRLHAEAPQDFVMIRTTTTYSDDTIISLSMKNVDQVAAAPEIWHCPLLHWHTNSARTTGYQLNMYTAGFELLKDGVIIADNYAGGLTVGVEMELSVLSLNGRIIVRRDGLELFNVAEATYTTGYIFVTALNCIVDMDGFRSNHFDEDFTSYAVNETFLATETFGAWTVFNEGLTPPTVKTDSTVYTLACETGAFALAGNEVQLLLHYIMAAEAGALALAGGDLTFRRVMQLAAGNFQLEGNSLLLRSVLRMACEAGVLTLGGGDATANRHLTLVLERKELFLGAGDISIGGGTQVGTSTKSREEGFRYSPSDPPEGASAQEVLRWALQELQKAGTVINNIADGRVAVLHKAPDKPRDGMVRKADGTDWNPGNGPGYYGYDEASGSWIKLHT